LRVRFDEIKSHTQNSPQKTKLASAKTLGQDW
jgi:hypothetical protein